MTSVLFLSYTGLLEPLGDSQVLPYVRGLAGRGYAMEMLSFEKGAAGQDQIAKLAADLGASGIGWNRRRYRRRPPVVSTVLDVLSGVRLARAAAARGVGILHARGHVPALMADLVAGVTGVPYLFDHRGLMADEFADAGLWRRNGALYRLTQRLERRFLRRAARVVVLTDRYRAALADIRDRVSVIPCAVDSTRFHPAGPDEARPFDLVYAGSWSGLYLTRETLEFFAAYRRIRPGGRMLLLVPEGSDLEGLPEGVEVRHPGPREVAGLLRLCKAGLSLRREGAAQMAASPVKVSEYLATGLLVVSSGQVGDLDQLVPSHRVGVIVRALSEAALQSAAGELARLLEEDRGAPARCRRLATERYALEGAIAEYDRAYRSILEGRGKA